MRLQEEERMFFIVQTLKQGFVSRSGSLPEAMVYPGSVSSWPWILKPAGASMLGNFSTLLTGIVMASFKGKRYKRRHLLKLQNTVRCEAHRELLLEGLKVLLEDYPE